jgi:hypothetical protein
VLCWPPTQHIATVKRTRTVHAPTPLPHDLVDVATYITVKPVRSAATEMIDLKKALASLTTTRDDDRFGLSAAVGSQRTDQLRTP